MKKIKIIYWVLIGITSLLFIAGGLTDLFRAPQVAAGFETLGYPAYLMTILGVAKLAAAIVLLVPGFPKLKEWAFAGLFIDLGGAIISHMTVEGFNSHVVTVLFFILILISTYIIYQRYQAIQSGQKI